MTTAVSVAVSQLSVTSLYLLVSRTNVLPAYRNAVTVSAMVTAMIILGYPGEIAASNGPRIVWGLLSTIPFIYVVYILFTELSVAMKTQTAEVRHTMSMLRWMVIFKIDHMKSSHDEALSTPIGATA